MIVTIHHEEEEEEEGEQEVDIVVYRILYMCVLSVSVDCLAYYWE
jgi:hypothetical protein